MREQAAMPPAFAARPYERRWLVHGAALAATWSILLILFVQDAKDMAKIYWTNTTFGHCLFIAPVIAWLVWQRRRELVQLCPEGFWPGLILTAAGGMCWLVGDAASVALFRHAGLVLMLQSAVVTILGVNVVRGLLFPLFYMLFLIPFGDFLEQPLQDVTVAILIPLLHIANVPATIDGVLITTPNGFFEVAEACSGAKFLIAMVAFGTLVANVCYTGWAKRAAFMATAIIVPIIANGVRAFATIYIAWWTSVEQATGLDHIIYGWFFFAFVMALVLAIGWRWFDRDPDAPWFDPASLQGNYGRKLDAPIASLLLLGVATTFLAWSTINAARTAQLPTTLSLPDLAGWERVPMSARAPWSPNFPGADHFLMGRYADAQGRAVDLAVAVYANQTEDKELVGFGIGVIRQNDVWVRVENTAALDGGAAMRMIGPGRVERETVSWYRVGDTLTGSDSRVKLATLKSKLLGGHQGAVAILVSAERDQSWDARQAMSDLVTAVGPLDQFADRMTGAR